MLATLTKVALYGGAAILVPLILFALYMMYTISAGKSRLQQIKAKHGDKVQLLQKSDTS